MPRALAVRTRIFASGFAAECRSRAEQDLPNPVCRLALDEVHHVVDGGRQQPLAGLLGGPGNVRRDYAISPGEQRIVGLDRLTADDVESGPSQVACVERIEAFGLTDFRWRGREYSTDRLISTVRLQRLEALPNP